MTLASSAPLAPPPAARGRLVFRPGWLPTLATALLLHLLLALGVWQLDRAATKEARRATLAQQAQLPELSLDGSAPWPAADALAYRRLGVLGRYDAAHQMLLDNQVQDGQAGYHVITPLTLAGGTWQILVNRGWVPAPADRRQVPHIPVPQGPVLARGTGQPPLKAAFLLAPETASLENEHWRGVWQYLTPERYAAARHQERPGQAAEVAPVFLVLAADTLPPAAQGDAPTRAARATVDASPPPASAAGALPAPARADAPDPGSATHRASATDPEQVTAADSHLTPRPVTPLPPDDGAARNRAYAGQWFAFAATLAALYLGLNLRRRP